MTNKLRVAVVFGGRSGEHEISLRSARSIIDALDRDKYEVVEYLISKEGKWQPRPFSPEPGGNPGIDVVFPVLHGTFGEDGTIQGLLEMAELPYVSAGVLASAVSMDKEVMKRLCHERGLPIVEYVTLRSGPVDAQLIADQLPFPMFVKPANLGSSVGISKVGDIGELAAAIEAAAVFDQKIVVERGIEGREFECSVMGIGEVIAATPCEILPSRAFYDYEDKYLLNSARIDLPASLTPAESETVRSLAIECYRAVECEVMARVDFLMERATGRFYINEINTIPGFTSISMFPKMWEHAGVPYTSLLDRLIGYALGRWEARRRIRYSR
jgi:D-alanine-D-alanine ligase